MRYKLVKKRVNTIDRWNDKKIYDINGRLLYIESGYESTIFKYDGFKLISIETDRIEWSVEYIGNVLVRLESGNSNVVGAHITYDNNIVTYLNSNEYGFSFDIDRCQYISCDILYNIEDIQVLNYGCVDPVVMFLR